MSEALCGLLECIGAHRLSCEARVQIENNIMIEIGFKSVLCIE